MLRVILPTGNSILAHRGRGGNGRRHSFKNDSNGHTTGPRVRSQCFGLGWVPFEMLVEEYSRNVSKSYQMRAECMLRTLKINKKLRRPTFFELALCRGGSRGREERGMRDRLWLCSLRPPRPGRGGPRRAARARHRQASSPTAIIVGVCGGQIEQTSIFMLKFASKATFLGTKIHRKTEDISPGHTFPVTQTVCPVAAQRFGLGGKSPSHISGLKKK